MAGAILNERTLIALSGTGGFIVWSLFSWEDTAHSLCAFAAFLVSQGISVVAIAP